MLTALCIRLGASIRRRGLGPKMNREKNISSSLTALHEKLQLQRRIKSPLVCVFYLSDSRGSRASWCPRWLCQRRCPHTSSSLWRASTAWACSGPARHTEACRTRSCWVQVLPPPGIWSWWLRGGRNRERQDIKAMLGVIY